MLHTNSVAKKATNMETDRFLFQKLRSAYQTAVEDRSLLSAPSFSWETAGRPRDTLHAFVSAGRSVYRGVTHRDSQMAQKIAQTEQ